MRTLAAAVATCLLGAAPVAAESFVWAAGTPGLVKADLDLTLFRVAGDGGTFDNIADPGITVTEDPAASGFYVIDELPDADADADFVWTLAFTDPDGRSFTYTWPARTRQPQALVWAQQVVLNPATATLAVGDTLPALQVTVTGLSATPAGGTATAYLYRQTGAVVAGVNGAAATISSVTSVTDEDTGVTTYGCTLTYEWGAETTTDAGAGTYYVRFKVVLTGGDVISLPSTRSAIVTIVR